jgi:hypothetical protein
MRRHRRPDINLRLQAFDELLLMKRGGRIIYFGALGHHSDQLINYFEASLLTHDRSISDLLYVCNMQYNGIFLSEDTHDRLRGLT